jgi:hypothetical protein
MPKKVLRVIPVEIAGRRRIVSEREFRRHLEGALATGRCLPLLRTHVRLLRRLLRGLLRAARPVAPERGAA